MANFALLRLPLISSHGSSALRIRASSNGVPFSKPKTGPSILEIPLEKIRRPLMRTRANDPEKVEELMESIRLIGLQEPRVIYQNSVVGQVRRVVVNRRAKTRRGK